MKKYISILLGLLLTGAIQALTVVVNTPGGLSAAVATAGDSLNTVTNLTIKGAINATDFKTMRDKMPKLAILDLNTATIDAYSGTEGTAGAKHTTYPANEIPQYAFMNRASCKGKEVLESVTISSTVKSIGSFAFNNCKDLLSVSIPSSVTRIGEYAFFGCTNLSSIYVHSEKPINLGANTAVFGCVNMYTCKLYVPSCSKSAYKSAEQWKEFNILKRS